MSILIPEWKKAARMFSVQAAALIVALAAAPAEVQALIVDLVGIPADKMQGVLALLVIVGRLINQPGVRETPDSNEGTP